MCILCISDSLWYTYVSICKTCKFCKQEIKMSDDSGRYNPYNKGGSAHDCRTKSTQQKLDRDTTTPYTLETVQRKLNLLALS